MRPSLLLSLFLIPILNLLPILSLSQPYGPSEIIDILGMEREAIHQKLRHDGWKPLSETSGDALFEHWEHRNEANDSTYLLFEWEGTELIGINYEFSTLHAYESFSTDLPGLGFELKSNDAIGVGRFAEYSNGALGITLETTYTGRKRQKGRNWNPGKDWVYRYWFYRETFP